MHPVLFLLPDDMLDDGLLFAISSEANSGDGDGDDDDDGLLPCFSKIEIHTGIQKSSRHGLSNLLPVFLI